MENKIVKLAASQVQLVSELRARLSAPMAKAVESVSKMIDEFTFIRIREMAVELGIDLVNEDWEFDAKINAFVRRPEERELKEVTPTIPKKRANTKAKKAE